MPLLGLNIDHVATLREARYRAWSGAMTPEPSVLEAARQAERAGVHSITVHLREDRRHIQEEDVKELSSAIKVPLNLEMAAMAGMVKQALRYRPEEVCLVPENREEVTTEGGLDVLSDLTRIRGVISKLRGVKIKVSAFIDADLKQVDAAHKAGATVIELHTGTYANAANRTALRSEIKRHATAAVHAESLGMQVNAGHGLNYENVREYIEEVPDLHTLNIGHAIVSRAVFSGLEQAVRDMLELLGSRETAPNAD